MNKCRVLHTASPRQRNQTKQTFYPSLQVFGIVQSHDDFKDQPSVMNGASDVMLSVFGPEVGAHARSAIGTNALPLDVSVEVECIVEIKK